MLKANELRIGNFIECTQLGGCLYKVVGIREGAFDVEGFPFGVLYERNEPALITPEILEKAGFVKRNLDNDLDGDYWCIKEGFRFLFQYHKAEANFYNGKFGLQIKHLHQLQNLYFALTGKELTLNLSLSTPYIPQ